MLAPGVAAMPGPGSGVVPVRLRTPSGKTALFYANAAALPPGIAAMASEVASSPKGALAPVPAANGYAQEGEAGHQAEVLPGPPEWAAVAMAESPAENAHGEPLAEANHHPSGQEPAANSIADGGIKSAASSQLHVGDLVYRHGELASVLHVDSTLDPAAYVVRMVQTGQEVSCEAEHLLLAACSDQVPPDELHNSSTAPVQSTLADAVQMQNMQQANLLNQASLSDAQQQQQQQFLQMQQLQYMQMQQMQQVQQAQQVQQMQDFYQLPQAPHLQNSQEVPQQPWGQQGLPCGDEAYNYSMEELQQIYQATSMQAGSPYEMVDNLGMQPQFAAGSYASASDMPSSPNHNSALKAVAEALDRAEVNMLTGNGIRRSSQPEPGFDGGDWPNFSSGDACSRADSSNFALKAAADALGALDRGGSLASRLGSGTAPVQLGSPRGDACSFDSGNFALQAAANALGSLDRGGGAGAAPLCQLGSPRGDSHSFEANFALKAAADALEAMDRGGSLASRLSGGAAPRASRGSRQEDALDSELASQPSCESHVFSGQRLAGPPFPEADMRSTRSLRSEDVPFRSGTSEVLVTSDGDRRGSTESLQMPDRQLEEGPAASVLWSISDQLPFGCDELIPLGGVDSVSGLSVSSAPMADDDDEELERMAQMEMEEDMMNFSCGLPPKPPRSETYAPPPPAQQAAPAHRGACPPRQHGSASRQHPQLQPTPAFARSGAMPVFTPPATPPGPPAVPPPAAPRGPAPAKSRSSNAKAKSKYQERDALLSFVLSDDPPSRATTPRNSSSRAHTPRGSSVPRSSLKTPVTAGTRRSQSHDIHFDAGGRRTPPNGAKVMTPRQLAAHDRSVSDKKPPHMLDFLAFDGGGTPRASKLPVMKPSSPRGSDHSSGSSLPQLSEKVSHPRKSGPPVAHRGSKSARNWRESAASLYRKDLYGS